MLPPDGEQILQTPLLLQRDGLPGVCLPNGKKARQPVEQNLPPALGRRIECRRQFRFYFGLRHCCNKSVKRIASSLCLSKQDFASVCQCSSSAPFFNIFQLVVCFTQTGADLNGLRESLSGEIISSLHSVCFAQIAVRLGIGRIPHGLLKFLDGQSVFAPARIDFPQSIVRFKKIRAKFYGLPVIGSLPFRVVPKRQALLLPFPRLITIFTSQLGDRYYHPG